MSSIDSSKNKKKNNQCKQLFAHSLDNLETIATDSRSITKKCPHCSYEEVLPRSNRSVYFVNNLVMQKKKWASDDNRKELLQPMNNDGSINDDFTEAYGYNPYDKRTELSTPTIQGGKA